MGKAKDLKARVSSYFVNSSLLGEKTKILVTKIKKIKITIVESELEALLLESYFIKKYNPKYNIKLTDNKQYLRVKITRADKYPRVLFARREENPNSLYFGPYPNSGAVKLVLKTIRRVFPFQSVMNHPKKICLFHHLGLCPCPPVFDSPQLRRSYKKNINNIIRIFEGGSKKLMKELEKERDSCSNKEQFEKALEIQKKINALSLITGPHHTPFEYELNPNLRVDIRSAELNGLMTVLNAQGFTIEKLERIECYDISNTQGTLATGSMVVFVNGEKETSQYRKFKIHNDGTPNDFASMNQVLKRRLRHIDWSIPDLIVIDGGKGQVTYAKDALTQAGFSIPVIGLAKREETIVIRDGQEYIEVSLSKDAPALHLLMRIRDEAHRFAITYHKKLRNKNALT